MENILRSEMCIKFESDEISINGDYCSKSDSKREDRREGTVVCVACRRSDSESDKLLRKSKTQLPWFSNRSDKHHYHCFLLVLFGRVGVFILVLVLCVIVFYKAYVAMLWRFAFSASFVRACTDVI